MKSAGKNSFYSFCGQNCKNPFLYFFCGPAEKEIPCGRAGQLPAAGAAGNGYASERCSIPQYGLRQALRGRVSASAGGYPAVPVRCSIPRCTRSDSGAGGGRLPDAAQEVTFPASRASNNSAGASERSACQPRQRLAKGDAASIRRSIPLSQEGVMRPGGYSGDPKFHVVDYASVANGVKAITDDGNKVNFFKTHRSEHSVRVGRNRQSCGFKFQICRERTIGGILADFVSNNKSLCLAGVFGNRAENVSVFNNKVSGGIDCYFRAFRKSYAFAVVSDREFNRAGITGLNKCLSHTNKGQAKDNSRSKNEIFNNKFLAKNSAAEDFSFGSARRSRASGAEEIISWCQKNLQRTVRYTASCARGVALCLPLTRRASAPLTRPEQSLGWESL